MSDLPSTGGACDIFAKSYIYKHDISIHAHSKRKTNFYTKFDSSENDSWLTVSMVEGVVYFRCLGVTVQNVINK